MHYYILTIINRIKLFFYADRKYQKSIEMQDAIFDKILLDISQKSVLKWIEIKWIELLGLDRIGLGFYTKKSIKVNRNVGYCF